MIVVIRLFFVSFGLVLLLLLIFGCRVVEA